MVLSCYLNTTSAQIHDRLVSAPVAELQLGNLTTNREVDYLMPQADAEHGYLPNECTCRFHGLMHSRGVTWPVREEHTVGSKVEDRLRRRVPGNHGNVAANIGESTENGAFGAAIIGDHVIALIAMFACFHGAASGSLDIGFRVSVVIEDEAFPAGNTLYQVAAYDGWRLSHLAKYRGLIQVRSGNATTHGTIIADMPGEHARVNSRDRNYSLVTKEVREVGLAAEIRGRIAHVVDNQASQCKGIALHVSTVDTVIANLRVSHGYYLTGI